MRLLFDLDGTLTDAGPGVTRCIQHALRRLGRPVPSVSELASCVGPPLSSSFTELLGSSDPRLVDQAIAIYRERFVEVGMFENAVYPAVHEGLARLSEAGHGLWVATSKPRVYARRILEHFKLLGMFAGVYGSELSGERVDKVSLIRHLLDAEGRHCCSYMIGDRRHDVEGAHANDVGAVGVLWGYGTRAELQEAGADVLVASMAELVEWAGDPATRCT